MIKDIKIEGMDAFKNALVAMKGSALPGITESDEGKILKVEEGAAVWGSGLPGITESDEGKVLTVEEGAPAWGEIESGSSLVYEDSVFHDVGDYKYTAGGATIIQALKTYVLSVGATKYAKTFDITLPSEGPYFSRIIRAELIGTYNSIPVNIPCIIWMPAGSPTQTCQLCFDSADGQMDIPNNGIAVEKIFMMGYGPANP